jgi:NAD(P) transhydrogenase subunit alpha
MRVAIPKEILDGERRVAVVPDAVAKLTGQGFEFEVESGAGGGAYFSDAEYREAGAEIVEGVRDLYDSAEIVLKVRKPVRNEVLNAHEVELIPEGSVLIGFLEPLTSPDLVRQLAERRITAFSMETIPRISRAQPMDALSSQATAAGYRSVLIAAGSLPKFLPMLTTAAGTIRPAKVLILGAGVAGLQAIATSRRLGGVVSAFDIRPAVKEEVESLGARFLQMALEEETEAEGGYAKEVAEETKEREQAFIHKHVAEADVVITTAAVPGRRAPILIEEEMVKDMRPGSVIVDLAAETGGNCALTETGETVVRHGVTIHGPVNLPATVPVHASQMYSRNTTSLLVHLVRDGKLQIDFEDEITRESCITHEGEVVNARVRELVSAG